MASLPRLYINWQGTQVRVRHDDPRLTPYSPGVTRLRSAVELASDVEGLRLVLGSVLGDRYRVKVRDDGAVLGLWRRTASFASVLRSGRCRVPAAGRVAEAYAKPTGKLRRSG